MWREFDTADVDRRGVTGRGAGSRPVRDARPKSLSVDDPRRLGPFQLVARLDHDAAEVVYLGKTDSDGGGGDGDGRWVAVTALHPDLRSRPELRERFVDEVDAVAKVRSPHVAEVVAVEFSADVQYVATEFVFGPSLADDVAANGPLSGADLRRLAAEVAGALAAFHRAEVNHLALTPSGVVRSATGARLSDLGLSRAAVGFVPDLIWAGAPPLWAPELWTGELAAAATDVWAWACVVTLAGTGRLPFDGPGLPGLRQAATRGRPVLDGLDPLVRSVVEQALRKDPALRPGCPELVARLSGNQSLAAGESVGVDQATAVLARPALAAPAPASPVRADPVPAEPVPASLESSTMTLNPRPRRQPPAVRPPEPARLSLPHDHHDENDHHDDDDGSGGVGRSDATDPDGGEPVSDDEGWRPQGARRREPAQPPTAGRRPPDLDVTPGDPPAPRASRRAGRRGRSRRWRLVATAVVVAAAAASVAVWRTGAAQPAGDASVVADALAKAAQLRATDPDLARRIELAAYRAEPGPATEAALFTHAQRRSFPSQGQVRSVAFSLDGSTVVAGGVSTVGGPPVGVLQMWDLARPETVRAVDVEVEASAVTNVRISPDGTTLAASGSAAPGASGASGGLWLWKLSDLARPTGYTAQSPTMDALAFGPDGAVVTDGGNNALAILNPDDAGNSGLLVGHTGPLTDVAFRPDGEAVASSSTDGTVRLWSFDDPGQPVVLSGHGGPVVSVAFSADGATLASLGQDGTLLVWDLAAAAGPTGGAGSEPTSRELAKVTVAPDALPRLAFSPDAATLAVPTATGAVRVWDLASDVEWSLDGHEAAAVAVAFSSDGLRLASGGADQTVRIWDLRPPDVVARLCADPASRISGDELATYLPGVDLAPTCA